MPAGPRPIFAVGVWVSPVIGKGLNRRDQPAPRFSSAIRWVSLLGPAGGDDRAGTCAGCDQPLRRTEINCARSTNRCQFRFAPRTRRRSGAGLARHQAHSAMIRVCEGGAHQRTETARQRVKVDVRTSASEASDRGLKRRSDAPASSSKRSSMGRQPARDRGQGRGASAHASQNLWLNHGPDSRSCNRAGAITLYLHFLRRGQRSGPG